MAIKHVDTGTASAVIILVTAFGAFPNARTNPTAAILARLGRARARLDRLGVTLRTAQLPVVYGEIGPALRATFGNDRPDAILHLGLASRRRAISIETRALNRANPIHPDAARRRTAQTIATGAPTILKATYPAGRLVAAVRGVRARANISIDAGDYVCNATLYQTLRDGVAPQAGFIHVPRPGNPGQPRGRARHRRPSLEDLTRAVLAAILALARSARPSAASKG